MTLLLGPPSSGKTTLLLALAAKLDPKLKVRALVRKKLIFLSIFSYVFALYIFFNLGYLANIGRGFLISSLER